MTILLALSLLGLALVLSVLLPVLGFVRASRALTTAAALRARVSALEAQVQELTARGRAADTAPPPPRAAPPVFEPGLAAADAGTEPPWSAPAPPPAVPNLPRASEPTHPGWPTLAPASSDRVPSESAPSESAPSESVPSANVPPPTAAADEEGLEAAIGGRLLLYVGTLVMVLGVAFFLKYAFDREWITEWMRVGLGAVAGAALLAGGQRFAAAGYAAYGQVLTGGGLAVLYLSVYAAFGFYALIGPTTAFVLLVLVTVAAAALSDRQRSQPMAIFAVGGGFLTPFLVGGGTDAQVTLFSYVALLVAGTMYLARRRHWPLLNVLSYAFTVLTVAAWASEYYRPAKYLRTEVFLTLYGAMFLLIRRDTPRSAATTIDARFLLGSAPALYHLASLAVLAPHGVALLVYLIAFTLVGVGLAVRLQRSGLRLVLWVAAMLPLLGWIGNHQTAVWIAPGLVTLGAIFALHLLAQLDRALRQESGLGPLDLVLLHLNGVGLFVGVYWLLSTQALVWVPVLGLAVAVLHAAAGAWLRGRDPTAALHGLAVAFTVFAAAIAVRLDGAWLTAAWAAEGAAVMGVGLRAGRDWFRAGGALLLAAAAGRWLALSVPVTYVNFRLIGNETFALGAFLIVLLYALAWLHHRSAAVPAYPKSVAALIVSASVLTVVVLTAENASYWDILGATSTDARFAEGLVLSLLWAGYAGLLTVVGIQRQYPPIRYAAFVLFGLTVGKVFLVDLSGQAGIYRVLGLLVVGTVLLVVSFLYQRTRGGTAPSV